MPRFLRQFTLLCVLFCQACSHLQANAPRATVQPYRFHFEDGATANYFVLDRRGAAAVGAAAAYPDTYVFVIAGSDCMSMARVMPEYFDGLERSTSRIRIFILQKRFIDIDTGDRCSEDFTQADYPSRWIEDQSEFMHAELAAAESNGQSPRRVVVLGISEGAEIAPLLAHRFAVVTHVALLGNGGMDPFEAYRLQAKKYGFRPGPDDILQRCAVTPEPQRTKVAGRACRYWTELQALRHRDNLLALDIPVFIAIGEADTMVPVESAWFIRDAFATRDKSNLRLLALPSTGHDFRRDGATVLPEIWEALLQWLEN